MNTTHLSSAQLKEAAKKQLEGKYGIYIGFLVLIQLVHTFTSIFLSAFFPSTTLASTLLQLAASFIFSIFLGVFQVGICLFSLNIVCGRPPLIQDMFFGYQNNFEKNLKLSLVVTGISFVSQNIQTLPLNLYRMTKNVTFLYAAIPVMLASIILFYYVSILFSQTFFLLLDFPSYSAKELLQLSIKVIKGHKKRYLYVDLSFIPLYILGLLSCGVGLLWVIPYQNITMANFYLDLMRPKQNEGTSTI